mgnify:CR=1 FL=1
MWVVSDRSRATQTVRVVSDRSETTQIVLVVSGRSETTQTDHPDSLGGMVSDRSGRQICRCGSGPGGLGPVSDHPDSLGGLGPVWVIPNHESVNNYRLGFLNFLREPNAWFRRLGVSGLGSYFSVLVLGCVPRPSTTCSR